MSIRPEDIPEEQEMTAVREAATSPKRKRRAGGRRLLRWSVRLAVGGGLLLVLLVALLPTLVSTNASTSRIVGAINERVPGQIEIDDLKLAWLKGLSLEGVRLYDPAGEVVGSLDAVRLEEVGLFGLLRGTRDLGIVAIEGGALSLVEDEEGQTNLDRALGTRLLGEPEGNRVEPKPTSDSPRDSRPTSTPQERDDPAWVPADLRLAFAMRDIKVSVVGPSLPDVRIDMPEATLTADGPAKLGFTLEATVAQGEDDGQVKIAGTVDRLFDDAGRPSWPDARFDVE
ncbi:MAG: AsmA family protein, partial [Planctomycetota bacterium]